MEECGPKCSPTSGPTLQAENITAITPSPTARLLNKQTAPYAIEDQDTTKEHKSIIFKLTLNQTSPTNQPGLSADTGQQWTLTGQNGSVVGKRTGLDMKKLLETLDSNNLTSEVYFDDYTPGIVNITISSWRGTGDGNYDHARELLQLESLLEESKLEPSLNLSAVIRDNHRLIARMPVRSKPAESGLAVAAMTVPPIRRTQDVVAENYTAKKIANEANIFALKLFEQLNIEMLGNGNIINSPFAIYQGLGLLMAGSMGDTSRELDRLLLSVQSVYENTKLTHDQDRSRLMASFGDVVHQLQLSSTNHFQRSTVNEANCQGDKLSLDCQQLARALDRVQYRGGSEEQHFIVANNLLFSPNAYEISNEFKATLSAHHNNTALTKIEIDSTESIQVINGWIRQATAGLIPAIIRKKSTFDEFNVMTMLSTSWLAQEWRNSFRRIASPLRSSIRLKGQTVIRGAKKMVLQTVAVLDEPLLEFVDDQKSSHFVEYIRSEPSRLIHNYRTYLNKQLADIVVVPFRDSNQRLVAITPLPMPADGFRGKNLPALNSTQEMEALQGQDQVEPVQQQAPAESSLLTKMIGNFAAEPRRVLRQLWATIAPEIITKQTMQSLQSANSWQRNSTIEARVAPMPPLVQLSMPLVRLEADSSLTAPLNHVGLVNAFDPTQANFIGINGHPFNYNKLHLSNVIYKTTFNLNEDGINYDRTVRSLEPLRISPQRSQVKDHRQEVDAASGELVNEVKLNKPYMFMVVDVKTRLILYTAVVRNPAK